MVLPNRDFKDSKDESKLLFGWSNWLIANNVKGRMPVGDYKISTPWLLINRTGSTYNQLTVDIEGEVIGFVQPTRSVTILPTFSDTFAIGIQLAKGVSLKNILFEGQNDVKTTLEANFDLTPLKTTYQKGGRDSRTGCRRDGAR